MIASLGLFPKMVLCKLCVTLQFCLFLCRWKGFIINSSIDFVIAAKGKLPCYLCRRPLQIQRQDRPHIDGVLSRSLNSNSWESTHTICSNTRLILKATNIHLLIWRRSQRSRILIINRWKSRPISLVSTDTRVYSWYDITYSWWSVLLDALLRLHLQDPAWEKESWTIQIRLCLLLLVST